jgi:hypothetical protein
MKKFAVELMQFGPERRHEIITTMRMLLSFD